MHELLARGPKSKIENCASTLIPESNAPGHRARRAWAASPPYSTSRSGTTRRMPRTSPIAMIPNCAATRPCPFRARTVQARFRLTRPRSRTGPRSPGRLPPARSASTLDTLTPGRNRDLETGRHTAALRQDAHRPRRRARALPGDAGQGRKAAGRFHHRVIYYVGPVDPVKGSGRPRRPPTATRHDKFTELMLARTASLA